MRYTILTPTLQRNSLIKACESVNTQTCTDWEHLVIFDGTFKDAGMLSAISHPNRRVVQCTAPRHTFGHACKHFAYSLVKGDYIFNLDDDNFLAHNEVLEDLKQVTGAWAIFPMLRFNAIFFHDPPGMGSTASENFLTRRDIGQWPNSEEYASDGLLVESLKLKYAYQSLPDIRPVAVMESNRVGKADDAIVIEVKKEEVIVPIIQPTQTIRFKRLVRKSG